MVPNDQHILGHILRNDFGSFVAKVFTTVCPNDTYLPNWHVGAICHELMRISQGENNRLVVNVPPRFLKTIIVSVAWVAWRLGHEPAERIVCASYSSDLAAKYSNDTRRVMGSDWYRRLFPRTRINPKKNTETEFETTRGGFRLATSVGGTLTGRGGNIIIVDDPLRAGDAHSGTRREEVNEWFTGTVMSRLDEPKTSTVIIVAQRLHVDDLSGHVLRNKGHWTQLNIPVIAETNKTYALGDNLSHHRKAGELLQPARMTKAEVEDLRGQMGTMNFSAQYQQDPVPAEGNMVKIAWFQPYTELPALDGRVTRIHSWDTAMTSGEQSDYSVCTVWRVKEEVVFLEEVVRERLDYPDLRHRVVDLIDRDKPDAVLIENKGSGQSLAQDLRANWRSVIPIDPVGDKVMRLAAVTPLIEGGSVHLPQSASWLEDFLAEVKAFPAARHDDQIDSLSQALIWIREEYRSRPTIASPIVLDGVSYWNDGMDY